MNSDSCSENFILPLDIVAESGSRGGRRASSSSALLSPAAGRRRVSLWRQHFQGLHSSLRPGHPKWGQSSRESRSLGKVSRWACYILRGQQGLLSMGCYSYCQQNRLLPVDSFVICSRLFFFLRLRSPRSELQ